MSDATAKGTLFGFARDANGNRLPGTLITASDGAHSYTTHSVAVDGGGETELQVELPAGTYLVKAEFGDRGLAAQQAGVVIKPNGVTELDLILTLTR